MKAIDVSLQKMRGTWIKSAGLLLLLASGAAAQELKRVQQDAAEEAARWDLRGQVMIAEVSPGLTVRGALQRVKQSDRVGELVASAVQLGGARWVDEQTCQIKLHLDAPVMGQRLKAIAIESHDAPLVGLIDQAMAGSWKDVSFEATGTSVPPDRVMALMPMALPRVWESVSPDERKKCVSAGHQKAVDEIIQKLIDMRYDNRTNVGTHLNKDSRAKLQGWANQLPITRAVYRDDKQVEIQVYVDQTSLRDKLKALMPSDAPPTTQFSQHVDALPHIVIGTASVTAAQSANVAALNVPTWIDNVLTSHASAKGGATKLLTAREAENQAIAKLRQSIESLPMDAQSTIGDRAKSEAKYSRALDRLIERSRVSKVNYQADGSVDVTITLDPNEVWDEVANWR